MWDDIGVCSWVATGMGAKYCSKPGRDPQTICWLFQASAEWSRDLLETGPGEVVWLMEAKFAKIVSVTLSEAIYLGIRRWMFSATAVSIDRKALFDHKSGVPVCGDWFSGANAEGAFRSGIPASAYILHGVGISDVRRKQSGNKLSGKASDSYTRSRL